MTVPDVFGGVLGWDLVIISCGICLLASAFFSGAETGYMSVSQIRLRQHYDARERRVFTLRRQLRDLEDPILTCLIGTNLFNVLNSAVMTWALTSRYGARGEVLAAILISVLVILFGEILPKTLYRAFPERLTVISVPLVTLFMIAVAPIRWLLLGYSALWRRLLSQTATDRPGDLNPGRLTALLLTTSNPAAGDLQFRRTLNRFLELSNRDLRSIVRPVSRLVTVRHDMTLEECLQVAAGSGFSRLPIVDEHGELPGYLLVRDLFFLSGDESVAPGIPGNLVHAFLLVDEAMSPYELFEELHSQGTQAALVVDRAGRSLGLVTLEDLIETVVGSVHDEFDGAGAALTA